jgi:hypothetical protein
VHGDRTRAIATHPLNRSPIALAGTL